MRYAIILAFAIIGCDPAETIFPEPDGGPTGETVVDTTLPGPGGEQVGSRIRLTYYAGDDGVKIRVGTYDSQLETACVFLSAADGVTRCLPSPIMIGGRFSDDACTIPVAYQFACSPTPAFVTVGDVAPCSAIYHVYEPGAPWMGPTYTKSADGACAPAGSLAADYEALLLGAEIQPDSFVGATLKAE